MIPQGELSLARKLAFSGIASLLFVTLIAIAGEAALRFIAPKSDSVKLGVQLDRSARMYGLKPNRRSLQTGVVVQTNSLGFRENEYPLSRQPGVRRIVVLGDSFTFGVGVNFDETFSKRLERRLNESGAPHEVINFGISGYNSSLELATYREAAARFKPDLVILGYVLNDTQRMGGGGERFVGEAESARSHFLSVHHAMKRHSLLYRFLAPRVGAVAGLFNARYALGATHAMIRSFADDAPGWLESRQALLDIVREAREAGAETLVVIFPMMLDFATYPLKDAHTSITRFCQDHGIAVLDMLPAFAGQDASELTVLLDGHPNGRAHEIFATGIYEHLLRNYAPPKKDLEAGRPVVHSAQPGLVETRPPRM